MDNTIDPTKKYKTRDGRAVTGLHRLAEPEGWYTIAGTVHDFDGSVSEETWTDDGTFLFQEPGDLDLALAEDQDTAPGLLTPDPLKVEYGAFVASVRANFAAGTFATATQEQFDAWLESLTPILRA